MLSSPVIIFTDRFKAVLLLWMFFLCFTFVFIMLSCLFLTAVWSTAKKGLTSWLSCVWCLLVFLSLSQMVSQVRRGYCLYWFMIFAFLFTFLLELCLCCVVALKSLPVQSFNSLIIPVLRYRVRGIECTLTFHYSFPWISSMSYVPPLRFKNDWFSYPVV